MHIETYTKTSMIESLCRYLNVTETQLSKSIEKAEQKSVIGSSIYMCKFKESISDFILKECNAANVDEILFFHLSRRLNVCDDIDTINLKELLTTENYLSDFLRKHNIQFVSKDNHIDIVYRGETKSLSNDIEKRNVCYLRSRLGHIKHRQDFCVNGFMIKDQLYKNSYARSLYLAPEFIQRLSEFVGDRNIVTDYHNNSKYYCYEYRLPLTEIVFDGKENLSHPQKIQYLLEQVIYRLYEYTKKYFWEDGNSILRLNDSASISQQYFISRQEITLDML